MKLPLEILVAMRYLRAHRPGRVRRLRPISLGVALCTLLLYAIHLLLEHRLQSHFDPDLFQVVSALRYVKYGGALVTVLVAFFIELIRQHTIFTAISTFGLFLGTGALVTVLSVMSGFEADLKHKILGTHAHVVITTPDRSFTDYREALHRIEKLPGVIAGTPYLANEVMVASPSNMSGAIIKGIDPKSIGKVTDLVKNTDVGSLENLSHPERLRSLGMSNLPPFGEVKRPKSKVAPDAAADDAAPDKADQAAPDKTDKAAPDQADKGGARGTGAKKSAPKDAAATAGDAGAAEVELGEEPPPPRKERKVLPGVVIGREMAKSLRVYLGDDVNVVSPLGDIGPTGPIPKAKPFRVAAIFFSGMYEYDSKHIYMDLPSAQRFLGVEDEVTGLELKLEDPDHTETVMAQVVAQLGPGPDGKGYTVEDWKQLNRSLFSALKLEKIAMFIALCFIILVAAFSIVSNGIMLVMEKGKEVAILKSMGARDGVVLRIFILLGLYMGLLGTIVGIGCGLLACVCLDRFGIPLNTDVYYITKLPVNLEWGTVLTVLVASLLLALCATVYPAWLASRLKPVDGLRLR